MRQKGITRREFFLGSLVAGVSTFYGGILYKDWTENGLREDVFITGVQNYQQDTKSIMLCGFKELGIHSAAIRGKKILLKPNIVEQHAQSPHIYTHPLVVRGATEAFLSLGARSVFVAEGPGHCRDTLLVLEESGFADVLF